MGRFLVFLIVSMGMILSFQNCGQNNFESLESSSQNPLPSLSLMMYTQDHGSLMGIAQGPKLTSESGVQCGSCQSLSPSTTYFALASEYSHYIKSGTDVIMIANNRSDYNVLVSKGARVTYNDQPSAFKRAFFEGPAKDYQIGKSGNNFIVKDSCGNISKFTIGQDKKIKFIFKDGAQELLHVSGDGFAYIYKGTARSQVYLKPDEFIPAGVNYLDSSMTSALYFANCVPVNPSSGGDSSSPTVGKTECGSCKPLGALTNYFALSSEYSHLVGAGQNQNVYAFNRTDYYVLLSKGGRLSYTDQPASNKRVYFEGYAKEYQLGITGNNFLVKDACGNISNITVGADGFIKLIFRDGFQVLKLVANGFQFYLSGTGGASVFLQPNEFIPAGVNYLDVTMNSGSIFAGCVPPQYEPGSTPTPTPMPTPAPAPTPAPVPKPAPVPPAYCGQCKSLSAVQNYFAVATEYSHYIVAGTDVNMFANNRTDYKVLVSLGGKVTYNDQPASGKKVYFQGPAKNYQIGKAGNNFKIKDSCGNISSFNIGVDRKLTLIFKDGFQELLMVDSNGFAYIYQGVKRASVYLATDEFTAAGVNYLDVSVNSSQEFMGCQ